MLSIGQNHGQMEKVQNNFFIALKMHGMNSKRKSRMTMFCWYLMVE